MHLRFSELFAPEGEAPKAGSGLMDTIELINEEPEETLELEKDTKPPSKEIDETEGKTDTDTDEEPEEIDELKEIEEELEGPDEEDLELTTPVRRREILKKYPQLFKDFPYLEKAYYREQQFTELLPTIDDAKLAVQKAEVLDKFDQDIKNGDLTTLLTMVKSQGNENFHRIVDNYLPALRATDQQAYYHILGNVIKDTIITMVRESHAQGEQGVPLQAAANVLNQFVFGTQNFDPPRTLSNNGKPEDNRREQEIQAREAQLVQTQFKSTQDDLQVRADNVLKATIDQHIDPKKSMTDYVRKNATREAFETLENLMDRDHRFQSLKDKLWEKAFQENFSKNSIDSIKSAYLSKAKTLLPSVIKKARNDALRGLGKRVVEDTEEETDHKGPAEKGHSTPPVSGKTKKASDIPKSMSTLDFLMKD